MPMNPGTTLGNMAIQSPLTPRAGNNASALQPLSSPLLLLVNFLSDNIYVVPNARNVDL